MSFLSWQNHEVSREEFFYMRINLVFYILKPSSSSVPSFHLYQQPPVHHFSQLLFILTDVPTFKHHISVSVLPKKKKKKKPMLLFCSFTIFNNILLKVKNPQQGIKGPLWLIFTSSVTLPNTNIHASQEYPTIFSFSNSVMPFTYVL